MRGEERVPLSPTPRSLDVGFGEHAGAELGGSTGAISGGATWGRRLGRVLGGIMGGVRSVAGRSSEGAAKYKGKVRRFFLRSVRSLVAREEAHAVSFFSLRQSFHLLPPPHLFPALPPPAINPRPILTFHDTTPFLSATTQGVLIVDEALVRVLGVERGFWIAVALAALEIEEDREVSLFDLTAFEGKTRSDVASFSLLRLVFARPGIPRRPGRLTLDSRIHRALCTSLPPSRESFSPSISFVPSRLVSRSLTLPFLIFSV